MPGEAQYTISSTHAGSYGYSGHGSRVKCSRATASGARSSKLPLHPHAVPHEKYRGIRYRAELRRYISEIRPAQPRKRKIWLGTYKTAEEAARAFDAGIFYTKKSITYNFEDSPSILQPLPANLSPEEEHVEIQKKAKAAAALASQPDDDDDRDDAKLATTKSHSYVATHRHNYAHRHFDLSEEESTLFHRHEIPREIQFSVVLNR